MIDEAELARWRPFIESVRIQNQPRVGDELVPPNGGILRVTDVSGDRVSWVRLSSERQLLETCNWTLAGWTKVVSAHCFVPLQ